ncbi:MAG: putative lipid II flippase FtsW [SAR324 cluster bacterium]|nr:putative lipid II flippase FtsW [SAR324 cluster bacterium]
MIESLRSILGKQLRQFIHEYDLVLFAAMAILAMVGVLMIYTATTPISDRLYGTSWVLLRNHAVHLVVGLGALIVGLRVPYARWERWVPVMLLLCLVLLICVLIPGLGHQVGGARRWVRLGLFNFQPVELLKFVLVAYVASYLDRKQDVLRQFFRGLAPNLVVMGVFLSMVVLQPDFGSVVLIAMSLLLMIFVGGGKPGHIFSSFIAFLVIGVYLISSQTYRSQRILAFLDPWQDRFDTGFQIVQSFLAFGTGGWLGAGLGDSRQKMFFLPDAHTDFIFAILGEELGLMGVLAVMLLFAVFLWRGFSASLGCRSDFGKYLGFGITTVLALEVLLNLAVVMGIMPTKGLPLPLISYGGSSLVMSLFMTGVLLNIGRHLGGSNSSLDALAPRPSGVRDARG